MSHDPGFLIRACIAWHLFDIAMQRVCWRSMSGGLVDGFVLGNKGAVLFRRRIEISAGQQKIY